MCVGASCHMSLNPYRSCFRHSFPLKLSLTCWSWVRSPAFGKSLESSRKDLGPDLSFLADFLTFFRYGLFAFLLRLLGLRGWRTAKELHPQNTQSSFSPLQDSLSHHFAPKHNNHEFSFSPLYSALPPHVAPKHTNHKLSFSPLYSTLSQHFAPKHNNHEISFSPLYSALSHHVAEITKSHLAVTRLTISSFYAKTELTEPGRILFGRQMGLILTHFEITFESNRLLFPQVTYSI
jgi:hypothetical protein